MSISRVMRPHHVVNMPDGDRDGMGLEVEHTCRVVDINM